MVEACTYDARVAMWPCDFTPDDADFRSLADFGCAVDKGDLLSGVESSFGLVSVLISG